MHLFSSSLAVPHSAEALIGSEMDQRKPAAGGKEAKVMALTEVAMWQEPGQRTGVPVLALVHRSCVALDESCISLHLSPPQNGSFIPVLVSIVTAGLANTDEIVKSYPHVRLSFLIISWRIEERSVHRWIPLPTSINQSQGTWSLDLSSHSPPGSKPGMGLSARVAEVGWPSFLCQPHRCMEYPFSWLADKY